MPLTPALANVPFDWGTWLEFPPGTRPPGISLADDLDARLVELSDPTLFQPTNTRAYYE